MGGVVVKVLRCCLGDRGFDSRSNFTYAPSNCAHLGQLSPNDHTSLNWWQDKAVSGELVICPREAVTQDNGSLTI